MVGVANECSDLLAIEGTTNVIEDIGRMALQAASLIHEYVKPSLIGELVLRFLRDVRLDKVCVFEGRMVKFQLSDDMKSRIDQCQKSCDALTKKFDRRVGMGVNKQVVKLGSGVKKIGYDLKEIKFGSMYYKITVISYMLLIKIIDSVLQQGLTASQAKDLGTHTFGVCPSTTHS